MVDRTRRTISRRELLRNGTAALAGGTLLAGCVGDDNPAYDVPLPPLFGGGGGAPSLGGTPSAGGVGSQFAYEEPAVTQEDATHSVTTADQLTQAVQAGSADNPAVVWVPPDAAIDMTERSTVDLENVIVASSRSVNHPGAIIYTETIGADTAQYSGGGIFDCGDNARLTGLRIRGPTSNVYDNPQYPGYIPQPDYDSRSRRYEFYDAHGARGVTISSGAVQMDNCELFGWSRMAVYVDCPRSYGRDQDQSYPQINNVSAHNNLMDSSGYFIEVVRGHPIIEQCFMNANRHSVAGFGYPDSGYTISECYIGPIISSFPIDQHWLGENSGSGSSPSDYRYRYRGGGQMNCLNSVFACLEVFEDSVVSPGNAQPAIAWQGVPDEGCTIRGNTFRHPPPGNSPSVFSQGHTPGGHDTGPHGFVRWDIGENAYNWDGPRTQQG